MFVKFITSYQWRFLLVFLLLGFLLGFSVHKLVLFTFTTPTTPTIIIYDDSTTASSPTESATARTAATTTLGLPSGKPRSISQLQSLLHTLDAQINASSQVISRLRQRHSTIPMGTIPMPGYTQTQTQSQTQEKQKVEQVVLPKRQPEAAISPVGGGGGGLSRSPKNIPLVSLSQQQWPTTSSVVSSSSATASLKLSEPVLLNSSVSENCFPRSEIDQVKFYHPQPPPRSGFHCLHPQGCVYVVYALPFVGYLGEQFSQQRLAIMETIHLVKSLGSRYVLVEPIFIITPHDNNKIEMLIRHGRYQNAESTLLGRYLLRSRAIYDLQLLNEYFNDSSVSSSTQPNRIIYWDDFIQLFQRNSTLPTSRIPKVDFLVMDHGPNPFEPNMKLQCENSAPSTTASFSKNAQSVVPAVESSNSRIESGTPSFIDQEMKTVNAYQEFYNSTFLVHRTFCQEAIRDGGWPITNKGLSSEQRAMKKRLYYAGQVYRGKLLEAVQAGIEDLQRKYQPAMDTSTLPSTTITTTTTVGTHSSVKPKLRPLVVGFYLWRSLISEKLYQWIEDPNLDYLAIRKKLLFSKIVWDTAFNYVQSEMVRPYVAMHIRRGDQLAKGLGDPFRSLDKAVELITRTVQRTNSRSVFIMTDIQNEEDLVSLRKQITVALSSTTPTTIGVHYFRKTPNAWKTEVQMMFVEMAVCTLADYFISSDRAYWASATPSRDIIEVRNIVFGMNKHTTIWFGRPGGARWKGPVVDTFTHGNDC